MCARRVFPCVRSCAALLGILTGPAGARDIMIVRSLSVTCVAARRAFLLLLALVVLVAFGASGREWTSCGLGVLELWPSVGCLSPSLTYRFLQRGTP